MTKEKQSPRKKPPPNYLLVGGPPKLKQEQSFTYRYSDGTLEKVVSAAPGPVWVQEPYSPNKKVVYRFKVRNDGNVSGEPNLPAIVVKVDSESGYDSYTYGVSLESVWFDAGTEWLTLDELHEEEFVMSDDDSAYVAEWVALGETARNVATSIDDTVNYVSAICDRLEKANKN